MLASANDKKASPSRSSHCDHDKKRRKNTFFRGEMFAKKLSKFGKQVICQKKPYRFFLHTFASTEEGSLPIICHRRRRREGGGGKSG